MLARINGVGIFYREFGAPGAPPLLLGHSLATAHEMWLHQVPLLQRHFRIIALDMRGHGRSEAPTGPYSLDLLAEDVAALADHLDLARFAYMGLSIGGMIGQALAFRHRTRLTHLILASTLTGTMDQAGVAAWETRIARVEEKGVRDVAEETLQRWFSPDFLRRTPRCADWIRQLILATPTAGYVGCARAIQALDLPAAALARIATPTLVLAGARDPGAPPQVAETIAAHIPGAKLAVIDDALHLCNIEKLHDFNEAVLDFLLR